MENRPRVRSSDTTTSSNKTSKASKTNSIPMKQCVTKLRNQQRLLGRYNQMVHDLVTFQFDDKTETILFHEKVQKIYKQRYPEFHIYTYIDGGDKNLLIAPKPYEEKLDRQAEQDRDKAYSSLEKLREFVEKFRSNPPLTCAVLQQCAVEMNDSAQPAERKEELGQFISNIAEYFFENIWQDDTRHFTLDSYIFTVFSQIVSQHVDRTQIRCLCKCLCRGLYKKLINQVYINSIFTKLSFKCTPQDYVNKLLDQLSADLDLMPLTQRALLHLTVQGSEDLVMIVSENLLQLWVLPKMTDHLATGDAQFAKECTEILTTVFQQSNPWLSQYSQSLVQVHVTNSTSSNLVENTNLIAITDLRTLLEILQKLIVSFEADLKQDDDYKVIVNKKEHKQEEIDQANLSLNLKYKEGKVFKAHEDLNLQQNMSQLKNVITELLKPNFKPSKKDLTHLLFLKKWETLFNFEEPIVKAAKDFLEERITKSFFDLYQMQAIIDEHSDEDNSSEDEAKRQLSKDEADAIKMKKKICSAVYKNVLQIFSYPGTCIDRIRDVTQPSRHGLKDRFSDILAEIYKDDVMQPKPSSMLRLQDYHIKMWFNVMGIRHDEDRPDYHLDPPKQLKLVELIKLANEKALNEWALRLENTQVKKQEFFRDLCRFNSQVNDWKKEPQIQPIIAFQTDYIPELMSLQQSKQVRKSMQIVEGQTWQQLIMNPEVSNPKLQAIQVSHPHKCIGLFQMYDRLKEISTSDNETAILSNESIFQFLKDQALTRYDQETRNKAQAVLDQVQCPQDDYSLAIEKAKEANQLKKPSEQAECLREAIEMAQIEEAFTNMTFDQNTKELSTEVRLLLIKQIGFDELLIMDYLAKPKRLECVVTDCVRLVLSCI